MYGLMDSTAICADCGGGCLDGERLCDGCRSERNGGRCAWDAGCDRRATHAGLCEEHARRLHEDMADLYARCYCPHGIPYGYDGCAACDQGWREESDAEYDRQQAARADLLGRLGLENYRALVATQGIEYRWQEAVWMQIGRGPFFVMGAGRDSHLVKSRPHRSTPPYGYPDDLDDVPF